MQLSKEEDINKSSFNKKNTQPDQEIPVGHYFSVERDADSQMGWEGQTDMSAELPFPRCKGET